MALTKVCGIETEYGIVVRGAENNPVSASSMLINAYVAATARDGAGRLGLRGRTPGQRRPRVLPRRRRCPRDRDDAGQRGAHQRARYYVDHAHPEISTPEVTTAREAVVWDRAAEEIVRVDAPGAVAARRRRGDHRPQEQLRRQGQQLRLPRELPARARAAVRAAATQITPHFVTRQIFCGAGKVGCELPGRPHDDIAVPDSASAPTSSRRRSASRPRSSGRS